jgi:predicted Zn-dependent peptidase
MSGAEPEVVALANGVRVVALALPHLESASASVFVRTGSACESARESGISHVVEHMAFKGTASRDCQRINLDAERLGAEVNAHTDKDHTAFHMRGLACHATDFVRMLGDIVCASTFPEAELERERQVILHEVDEDDDDPLATAFKLFDTACFGTHALAQPVIGRRRNIERFSRTDLTAYVRRQYTGANVIVGVAGAIDPQAVFTAAGVAFGALPRGDDNRVEPPVYAGGVRLRRQTGSSQTHVVLGFPIPALAADDASSEVAAALFGEGMSSPLLDVLRERRALVYYAACSADLTPWSGQFVIEASTAPHHLDDVVTEVARLLVEHGRNIDAVGLERARNQIAVRRVQALERPARLLEEAAQDLFVHGRVRSRAERAARIESVTAGAVREAFRRMLAATPAVAVAGRLGKGLHAGRRFGELLASRGD